MLSILIFRDGHALISIFRYIRHLCNYFHITTPEESNCFRVLRSFLCIKIIDFSRRWLFYKCIFTSLLNRMYVIRPIFGSKI